MTNKKAVPPKNELEALTVAEAMVRYGVSMTTVYRWMRSYGMVERQEYRPPLPETPPREELAGLTLAEISQRWGVSTVTAQKWRSELGMSSSAKRESGLDKLKEELRMTKENAEKTERNLRMAAAMPFLSNTELAKAFGVSAERVRQIRERIGIVYVDGETDDGQEA